MSLKSLPLLFVNLGGEMIYILQQRLGAQSIDVVKAQKVLNEIVSTMFNGKFMEELFKPQELYSKKAVRTVFDRLAHSSIMRLNSASMDKLYDLMTMAVKYQISLIEHPRDVILVTLNHIDGVRSLVGSQPVVQQNIDGVYHRIMQAYGSLKDGEFQLIRQTLLSFFQDTHVRVSIFLKERQQLPDGQFVLPTKGTLPQGTEVPGTIRYFDKSGQLMHETAFDCAGCGPYSAGAKLGSRDIVGDRATALGTNLYASCITRHPVDTSAGEASAAEPSTADGGDAAAATAHDQLAKAQLDLLCHLIGGGAGSGARGSGNKSGSFRLNLFSSAGDSEVDRTSSPQTPESEPAPAAATNVVTIDATRRPQNAQLVKIMGDLSVGGSGRGGRGGGSSRDDDGDDDLLELMDRA